MSKVLGMVNTLDIEKTYPYLDGYIFGLKDFSINFLHTFSKEELESIYKKIKENGKEIYFAINKNLHNDEIKKLKEILLQIEKLNIDGIFYADNAFITLKEELKLKTKLIWYQEHLSTSYSSINTYYELGIKSATISNDITLHEVKEIIKNTKSELYYMVFGYLPMFVSERNQIKNYEKYFNIKGSTEYNYFICEGKKYPIIDNHLGTMAFSFNPICAYQEYLQMKDDLYAIILSDLFIKQETYLKIIQKFKEQNEIDINSLIETSSHFLYQDTIYKIK